MFILSTLSITLAAALMPVDDPALGLRPHPFGIVPTAWSACPITFQLTLNGNPVSGAKAQLGGGQGAIVVTSDPDGWVGFTKDRLHSLPWNRVRETLIVTAPGAYLEASLPLRAESYLAALTPQANRLCRGRLVDHEGQPIEGMVVHTSGSPFYRECLTDSRGSYALEIGPKTKIIHFDSGPMTLGLRSSQAKNQTTSTIGRTDLRLDVRGPSPGDPLIIKLFGKSEQGDVFDSFQTLTPLPKKGVVRLDQVSLNTCQVMILAYGFEPFYSSISLPSLEPISVSLAANQDYQVRFPSLNQAQGVMAHMDLAVYHGNSKVYDVVSLDKPMDPEGAFDVPGVLDGFRLTLTAPLMHGCGKRNAILGGAMSRSTGSSPAYPDFELHRVRLLPPDGVVGAFALEFSLAPPRERRLPRGGGWTQGYGLLGGTHLSSDIEGRLELLLPPGTAHRGRLFSPDGETMDIQFQIAGPGQVQIQRP